MEPQVITTQARYKEALEELDRLLDCNPSKNSSDGTRLNLIALLIENYEKEHFPIDKPTPLEAIKFRMDEQGLVARDLEPFIGSRSKVSEVLSGKVPLNLRMIRELHRGLGIPLEILTQSIEPSETRNELDWSKVPVAEMVKLGWIVGSSRLQGKKEELARKYFQKAGTSAPVEALYRRTEHTRSAATPDRPALAAWLVRASICSRKFKTEATFNPATLTLDTLKRVAHYSAQPDGPLAVRTYLLSLGIVLTIVPHLSRTRLDGAAFLRDDCCGVVALTLRHDRVDNFWFTLLHELAHLARHTESSGVFFDDLDIAAGADALEEEADALAREAIVPRQLWARSEAFRVRSQASILALATQMKIHPALVAGRLRYEARNYRQFNNLVGHGQIRVFFRDELGKESG
jgi:HTH-type transcriptional regulator/antitoxin HigA